MKKWMQISSVSPSWLLLAHSLFQRMLNFLRDTEALDSGGWGEMISCGITDLNVLETYLKSSAKVLNEKNVLYSDITVWLLLPLR